MIEILNGCVAVDSLPASPRNSNGIEWILVTTIPDEIQKSVEALYHKVETTPRHIFKSFENSTLIMADKLSFADIPEDEDFKFFYEGYWLDCAFAEIDSLSNVVVIFDVNSPDDEYSLSEDDINNPELFQLVN